MNKVIALILAPLALLYGFILALRNRAFDWGWLPSYRTSVPSITVGNLSVGGTGKTPMVEWLLQQNLSEKPAVVSRGYGRKSKGLLKVNAQGNAADYGDESLQIAQKFPEVQLWVSEERKLGAQAAEEAHCDLIVYDDAFQHRYVKGGFQIMLSSFDRPFFEDWVLPAGRLREWRSGAKRSNCIVITKCPANLSEKEQAQIRKKCQAYSSAPVLFSTLAYDKLQNHSGQGPKHPKLELITAIAKPAPLIAALQKDYTLDKKWLFKDHHLFNNSDLATIFNDDDDESRQWACSEKDYVKLAPRFEANSKINRLFVLPVKHQFLNDGEPQLKSMILKCFSKAQD